MKKIILALAAALLACAPAHADDYPSRPIRLIVPFAPGGGTDVLARIVGQRLSEKWGKAVIVENQPGASGSIGSKAVERAAPDGYTLVMASTGALMSLATFYDKNGPFDVNAHFSPVTLVADPPYVITASAKLPVKNVTDLIALAKSKPGQLTFGSSGVGAASHLSAELFQKEAGVEMLHVPYKGTGAAVTDLISGRIDIMFAPPQTVEPLVKAGKLKALATTGKTRSPLFPDLPTASESGLPGYEAVGWFGLLAPAHTPEAIVRKLNEATVEILKSPDVRERLAKLGAEPHPMTPDQYAKFITTDLKKWT
ncbi:MAG TPA: tripartite tricarboxylate transporter substrate binding protein, partial [Pseudolabrys sp.]|nr:tripartite tricarboxylate transporter substrate binding protein [Pseudolabrys sp.]